MAIKYCDFLNGDDVTGDGSFGNPYQKITTASTGLTGGDEVRCAKSPDDIDLSGTLAFVDDSNSIATSVDLTGVLSAMDFIYKTGESDNICEISTITSTIITLETTYRGTTETVSAKKLGVTDTGISTGSTETIQEAVSSGTSDLSRLKISGGWDLATQVQDGKTFFEQTGSNLYGYGLNINTKTYLEVEDLVFLRYLQGIYLTYSNYNTINNAACNNNVDGIYLTYSNYNIIDTPICNNNNVYGACLDNSNNNVINNIICNDNYCGASFISSKYNNINNIICNDNISNGIYQYGLYEPNFINNYSGSGNSGGDVHLIAGGYITYYPIMTIQHFNAAGDNRCYYQSGITYRDTAEARSTQCLRYAAVSSTYYIQQEFKFGVLKNINLDVSFHIKDNVDFNGDVQAALFFMGVNITNWETIPTTTDYVKQTFTVQASDITEDSILKLKIKVRGTAGNVYIDDFEVS